MTYRPVPAAGTEERDRAAVDGSGPSPALDDLALRISKLEELRALRVAEATGKRTPGHAIYIPHQHQIPPTWDWYLWLLLGGRGCGKTDGCAYYYDRWMRNHPGTRGSIIAPTLGDGVESCVNGPAGLKVHNPTVRLSVDPGGTHVRWPNGSEAKLFGVHTREDVERLRAGGNREIVWCEELAAWRYLQEGWEQMEFGLRSGGRPHVIASTTPKPRPLIKKLHDAPTTALSTATTYDNPALPAAVRDALREKYEGTRMGRQELLGQLIEEAEGALWTYRDIEACRVDKHPDLVRVVVAIDPSGGDADGNDEQGIIVAGLGVDGHGYVLADRSCKLTPAGWGKRAIRAWREFDAGEVVAETNYGGAMVKHTVDMAAKDMDQQGVRVEVISASRGKVQRAEPVAALYEQRRVHHVGILEDLELQQTQWEPESGWSPDRMDALVWAITRLMVDAPKQRRWAVA